MPPRGKGSTPETALFLRLAHAFSLLAFNNAFFFFFFLHQRISNPNPFQAGNHFPSYRGIVRLKLRWEVDTEWTLFVKVEERTKLYPTNHKTAVIRDRK